MFHSGVLYNYLIGGYLSAVDVLREIVMPGKSTGKVGKSEVLKKHLFDKLFDQATVIDADVKNQIVDALRAIPVERWEDRTFYDIEEHLKIVQDVEQISP